MASEVQENRGDSARGASTDSAQHSLGARIKAWVAAAQRTRPFRVFNRYSERHGPLLGAGMAYQALFAVFAALYVGFTVAGLWLRQTPVILGALLNLINRSAPGLVGPKGAIDTQTLLHGSTLSWTGLIALGGLLLTAVAWLDYTRQAIRVIFGVPRPKTNFFMQKLRDLGLGLAFGGVLVATAIITVASTAALDFIFELIGVGSDSIWSTIAVRIVTSLAVLMLDTVTLAVMFRVLAGLAIPVRRLLGGSLLGGIALGVLKVLGGSLLGGATRNPLLVAFAVFIGLLLWFNFMMIVTLFAASWIAVGMEERGLTGLPPDEARALHERREREARLLLAQEDLDAARHRLRRAQGLNLLFARHRVRKAEERLAALPLPDAQAGDEPEALDDEQLN